jgi:hypothetical protein
MALFKYIFQPVSQTDYRRFLSSELQKIERSLGSLIANDGIRVIKHADTSRDSEDTPAQDPDLIIPLTAGFWDVSMMINTRSASSTPGLGAYLVYSGTLNPAPPAGGHFATYSRAVTGIRLYHGTPGFAVTGFSMPANTTVTLEARAIFEATTPGTFSFYWAQSESNAVATVVAKGSHIHARPIEVLA